MRDSRIHSGRFHYGDRQTGRNGKGELHYETIDLTDRRNRSRSNLNLMMNRSLNRYPALT